MKATTISVHWHDECQPVYSINFQPGTVPALRLATAGGDNNVRLWRLKHNSQKEPSVEYLCTLRKHTQAVNAVRFDASGRMLASASDDGLLLVWTLSQEVVTDFGHQDDDAVESWSVLQVHNTNLEIYDIAWSPDLARVAVACMDNTLKVYNIERGLREAEMATHAHYVQGVAWDPKGEYLATLSADRSVHVHKIESLLDTFKLSLLLKTYKTDQYGQLVSVLREKGVSTAEKKPVHLFYSETLQSFFRRLAFSPDGSLLLAPLGVFKKEDETAADSQTEGATNEFVSLNTVYVFIRSGLDRPPVCHIPGLPKPAVAVSFSPLMYKLSGNGSPVFALAYKMIFAIATQNSVFIYDTEKLQPLGMVNNLHYLTITDISWENDGQALMVSSAEGFCSMVAFEDGVFGELMEGQKEVKPPKVEPKLDARPVNTLPVRRAEAKPAQSLISQFVAAPIIVKDEPSTLQTSSKDNELASQNQNLVPEEQNKKRVVPTLLQDYK
ncbi:hypothetical protein PUMCH_002809 [Australozyma saopauloensis]|uniref:CAF1B/HIR1 beta-propeller domain-containing protein n=1 Tax=Australozyma saopauloensis TaxID=291208 RepID=A0AAX4HAX2_9ASCO|nr:hypothetical protein PUMCH_002809 [[Candida] saopauloensis]